MAPRPDRVWWVCLGGWGEPGLGGRVHVASASNLLCDLGQAAVPRPSLARRLPLLGSVERTECHRGGGSAWKRKRRFPWGQAGQERPAS